MNLLHIYGYKRRKQQSHSQFAFYSQKTENKSSNSNRVQYSRTGDIEIPNIPAERGSTRIPTRACPNFPAAALDARGRAIITKNRSPGGAFFQRLPPRAIFRLVGPRAPCPSLPRALSIDFRDPGRERDTRESRLSSERRILRPGCQAVVGRGGDESGAPRGGWLKFRSFAGKEAIGGI